MTRTPSARSEPLRTALSRAACVAAGFAALVSTMAFGQLANEPLLTRAPAVKPNLLFVLDDSGSMGGSAVYAGHFVTGTGSCGDNTYSDNSPINNLLFYDPAKRYEPAFSNAGTQLANAPIPNNSDWNTFNIYMPKTGQNIPALTSKSDICDSSRYDRIRIQDNDFRFNTNSATTTNPLPVYTTRTDCAVAEVPTRCTLAQEKQNISNWRTWHDTRFKAAKAGVAKAFASQPDTFRLGYATIHVGSAAGTGSGAAKLWGVKDFFLAKGDFYTWLNALNANGFTPLRKALDIAGQYYSRSDNGGPWAHSPWQANSEGEAITAHLSCRRNFTILVTDGEWNDSESPTPGSRANVDGVNGPVITHSNNEITYQYKPRDTDPRSVGKADKSASGNASDWGNTLADVAMYYWVRDLRTDLLNNASAGKQTDKPFWQNMTTYTAAFGPVGKLTAAQIVDARKGQVNWTTIQPDDNLPETIDDLIHAAHNGGGEFLTLTDAASFATEIGRVVSSISGQQFSQAGVAASAVTLSTGTRKFVPYYTAGTWWGNVKMIGLKANGDEDSMIWEVVPSDAQGQPIGPAKIAPWSTRAIYTWTPTAKGIPFTAGTLIPTHVASMAGNGANTATLLHSGINTSTIAYIRGDRTNEGDLPKPFRAREALLGDIVNSTPVFIKNNSNFKYENLPAGTLGLDAYAEYMGKKKARPEGVLFIGANDGMVHAFREGTNSTNGGSETFAYIPQAVFGNLHLLANRNYGSSHRFFVDGPLSESDAYISAPNLTGSGNVNRWTNLVLGTAGAGARSVFALDATEPLAMSAKSVLWEVNNTRPLMGNLGFVMNQVETGITTGGQWIAVFGNGPYGDSGRASLFVVNLADGSLLAEIGTNAETSNGLGGVRAVRNDKSQIVGVYAGDLQGNVWRFDLSAPIASWPTSGQLLYTAKDASNNRQPITATPGVMPRPDTLGGYMVIVGTGKLHDSTDQTSVQTQAAYGLWDKSTFGGSVTFSGITSMSSMISVNVALDTSISSTATSDTNPDGVTRYYKTTVSRTPDWAIDRGWFINYTLTPGQRTIFSVEPTKKVVRIDTIAPRSATLSCALGTSQGFNYLVNPLTGTCRAAATFDTNNDDIFDTNDSTACIYSTEADGEDVVLDVLDANNNPTEYVDIQDSRGHIKARVDDTIIPPPPTSPGVTRSWRQLFMRPN